mmetsp:Transcript_24925/g.36530  ORF Transcript_24925/g.36530 Transcript_24925/m.36530 type:complete len:339 (-) Transcript_24925:225-1241(-)|eukprot:CAMPEP_0194042690 /NCGR_PEP_ID=MMETSP0009_2-20130614/14440_1 /TAXON_ID=210454 /ORGANISM="Grammatophora oceanica, Strain CCMP 410" /LENGTH=338 /DNA_ID=CAMNT_0038686627 /DNA_START=208 /DNA_END=1224 /DNA_ORIENTATION=-
MSTTQEALAASAPLAVLEPIYNEFQDEEEKDSAEEEEILRDGLEKRKALYVTKGVYLTLGRNDMTGIEDLALSSHRLCRIRKIPRSFRLEILNPNHDIYINGQPVIAKDVKLNDGFVISLFQHKYAYRFRTLIATTTISQQPSSSTTASTRTQQQPQKAPPPAVATTTTTTPIDSSIAKEVECALCFDIMVKTTSLPCGHCFCQSCVQGETVCPTCRQTCGETRTHIKSFDALIYKLILCGGHFDKGDTKEYLDRTGLPPPPSPPPPASSISKKRSATGGTIDAAVADDASSSKRQRTVLQATTHGVSQSQPQIRHLHRTPKTSTVSGASRDTAISLE